MAAAINAFQGNRCCQRPGLWPVRLGSDGIVIFSGHWLRFFWREDRLGQLPCPFLASNASDVQRRDGFGLRCTEPPAILTIAAALIHSPKPPVTLRSVCESAWRRSSPQASEIPQRTIAARAIKVRIYARRSNLEPHHPLSEMMSVRKIIFVIIAVSKLPP